jgi:hypothetical protein
VKTRPGVARWAKPDGSIPPLGTINSVTPYPKHFPSESSSRRSPLGEAGWFDPAPGHHASFEATDLVDGILQDTYTGPLTRARVCLWARGIPR